jgi:hypothetical protein
MLVYTARLAIQVPRFHTHTSGNRAANRPRVTAAFDDDGNRHLRTFERRDGNIPTVRSLIITGALYSTNSPLSFRRFFLTGFQFSRFSRHKPAPVFSRPCFSRPCVFRLLERSRNSGCGSPLPSETCPIISRTWAGLLRESNLRKTSAAA